MSGCGRKSGYRKGVTSQYSQDEVTVEENDLIGKVTVNRGGNLFDAMLSNGETVVVQLPKKFFKVIWIKPKDYVVVETPVSASKDEAYSIKFILSKDQIKNLRKINAWPSIFTKEEEEEGPQKSNNYMDDIMPDMDQEEEEEGEYEEES
jgi:translation initiation factor IF-1